jgi:hypothetical protein
MPRSRRRRRFLFALLLVPALLPALLPGLAAAPVVARAEETAAQGRARWTVMVYMSGDNNLEGWIVRDLERELGAVGSTAEVQVVALADRGPKRDASRGDWKGAKLFHVTKGMRATADNAVQRWGERNLGNPNTLIQFVNWSRQHYPADRYALVFWGHSWSWHKGYNMEDETSKDALDPGELRTALPRLGQLDFVAYDACNVAAVETQALWRGHAAAIAHSQEWVDVGGLEYDLILRDLAADPGMDGPALAVRASRSAQTANERTWSAVALDDRHGRLERAVDVWSQALLAGMPRHRAAYDRALRRTQHFVQAPMDRDLADLAAEINREVDDPTIDAAGEEVIAAVAGAVLDEWHRPQYADAHGITVFVPVNSTRSASFSRYRKLDFARSTHWDEFLRAWRR